MGQVVLTAKITHVPSMLISQDPGVLEGRRNEALGALRELGRRARERGADTFLVFDTHWLSNFGCHMNAKARHEGIYTSHEAPHMIQNLRYSMPGNPALADRIAAAAAEDGLTVLPHRVETLPLEYGTIVPMLYLNPENDLRVLPVASPLFASCEENRRFGAAARRAIEGSDAKVAVIASGSLSHKLVSNAEVGDTQWDRMTSEFNRQVDLRVLELWRQGRWREFCRMLPDYAVKCNGEALMADTEMLFGLLGWDGYEGKAEILCDYFLSSGSGQVTAEFSPG